MKMDSANETIGAIEACRTCGIFYMTTSNYLKHLFQSPIEQPDMMLIRLELSQWKVEVAENDGFPQYVCNTCIHEFQKIFKFRASCIETQEQLRHFYNLREENLTNVKIKTEVPDLNEEEQICDFIYVDELSDSEYDGTTPFNIPHVPIKEELIEEATIPMDASLQDMKMVEASSKVIIQPSLSTTHEIASQGPNSTTTVIAETPAAQVECNLCHHISPNKEKHKQHMQRCHEMKNLECHICGKQFKNITPARLKFHMKWHTLNKHVKCALCGFVCNSKYALKEHKRINHGKIICKICGKGVLTKKLKTHLQKHELVTKYSCEFCTKVFSSENERENHLWQRHASEESNQSPTTSIPSTVIAPEVHENIYENIYEEEEEQNDILNLKYLCAHCDQRFIEQIDLETHVNEDHHLKNRLIITELENDTSIGEGSTSIDTVKVVGMNQTSDLEHTNIAVFEDYDNEIHENSESEQHEEDKNVSSIVLDNDFTHSSLTYFTNSNERAETVSDGSEHSDSGASESKKLSKVLSEGLYSDEESPDDEINYQLQFYNNNNLNTFACAKCTETFSTVEQLRQHHEQHLSVNKRQLQEGLSKSKFKCNLCGKSFDLKFTLNRHVIKHKRDPF